MRIAIVDDRKTSLRILKKLTETFEPEAEIVSFAEARDALAWLVENTADLIIADFTTPQCNGAQFTRLCRSEIPEFDTPIVVVTAYEDRDYRYEALEAGATDFLFSPIDYREFRIRVRNLLAMRRQKQIAKGRAVSLEKALSNALSTRENAAPIGNMRLRLVIDSTPNFIFVTDGEARVTLANRAFAEACGATPEQIVGERLDAVSRDHAFARHSLEHDRRVLAALGPQSHLEHSLDRADGERVVLQSVKLPIMSGADGGWEVLTVCTDVRRRKEIEFNLGTARQAAELSNRAKTEFLANVSHELRTPLNAIIGFADVMQGQLLGPIGNTRYLEYIDDIKFSADHLLRIIDDILQLSQIEAGSLDLRDALLDVEPLVGDVVRLVRARAIENGLTVTTSVASALPYLKADETKVKQILVNVLANAVKFTPRGGRISVAAEPSPTGGIRVAITDTGIGMTEAEVEIALSRFGRIESAMSRREPGTGLGLPLSVDLARRHDAIFDLQSSPDVGTTVVIDFPASRSVDKGLGARLRGAGK